MKKALVASILAVSLVAGFSGSSYAGWVSGYTKSNGSYVQPYYRSNPDASRSNNYGPSTNSYDRSNPYARDNDKDGVPNHLDRDDNNNGRSDDYESNQYRRTR